MRSARGSVITKTLTAIYFVSWIFIGNFILLNLFLAILIDSFSNEETESNNDIEQSREAEAKAAAIRKKRLIEEKEKRLRKLGAMKMSGMTKSFSDVTKKGLTRTLSQTLRAMNTSKELKRYATMTGTNQEALDLIDDIDELN